MKKRGAKIMAPKFKNFDQIMDKEYQVKEITEKSLVDQVIPVRGSVRIGLGRYYTQKQSEHEKKKLRKIKLR